MEKYENKLKKKNKKENEKKPSPHFLFLTILIFSAMLVAIQNLFYFPFFFFIYND